ncbi:hypothetical protein BH09SUM1_BH09SUM1_33450 [soil metagenome]
MSEIVDASPLVPAPHHPSPITHNLSSRAQFAVAFLAYVGLVFLGYFPDSLHFFDRWVAWFEDPSNCYRVWWFSEVIYHGRGSIWFMPDLLWPNGLKTMQTSNGLGKELFFALIGGGKYPWLAGNIISLSTPITVGLAAFYVIRRELHGAFLPALLGGWFAGWNGAYMQNSVSPWMASSEGLILFLGILLQMRRGSGLRLAILAGLAAGLSLWLQMQMMAFLTGLAMVFIVDRLRLRDYRAIGWLVLAGFIAAVIASPLIYQTLKAYDWKFEGMAGSTADSDYFIYRARLSTLFLPQDPSDYWLRPTINLLGGVTTMLNNAGLNLHTDRSGYLGWVVMILAFIGWRTKQVHVNFIAACFLFFTLLSFGPVISLGAAPENADLLFGPTWIPGPFLFLERYPPFNAVRTPVRFLNVSQICLAFLAAHGALHLLRRRWFGNRVQLRPIAILIAIMLHMSDIRWPMVLFESQYTPFYEVLARDPDEYTVLDIPYTRGMHQYMHYAAYHNKHVPWGFGSRVPDASISPIERDLAFPMIPTAPVEKWPRDFARFAWNLRRYNVRYLVLHEQQLTFRNEPQMLRLRAILIKVIEDPRTWARQRAVNPPKLFYTDHVVRVYRVDPIDPSGEKP